MIAKNATLLITGGAGFIGTALCDYLLRNTDHQIINVDCLTYAANLTCIQDFSKNPRYIHINADICDIESLQHLFKTHSPNAIMHLAAESHVDRSITGPAAFIQTNVVGTTNLLQAAGDYYKTLPQKAQQNFRFHHISTDEVYGSLTPDAEAFTEHTAYDPRSPYSASKAASDHFVRAWAHTYNLPVVISNCSNNYGPWQFPEKLIPVIIRNAYLGNPIPIYGDGKNIRDWLYVDDHAEALYRVLCDGKTSDSYNIGGEAEEENISLAHKICALMDEFRPENAPHNQLITFVTDRPGHDFRYAMNISKIKNDLGWTPSQTIDDGLRKTVQWYLEHKEFLLQAT